MNQRRSEYQNKVEQVMQYLKKFELLQTVQTRIRNWFQYIWEDRNTLSGFHGHEQPIATQTTTGSTAQPLYQDRADKYSTN
ncbi:unnamed protein product [Adineta steineri]|uniref:Uncharacterized protein n=2 Tax=Adineta steineri TaxID=433720 RepID=A0A818S8U0_9BILA|nr:unnamed protein product [Adineta steineri]